MKEQGAPIHDEGSRSHDQCGPEWQVQLVGALDPAAQAEVVDHGLCLQDPDPAHKPIIMPFACVVSADPCCAQRQTICSCKLVHSMHLFPCQALCTCHPVCCRCTHTMIRCRSALQHNDDSECCSRARPQTFHHSHQTTFSRTAVLTCAAMRM